MDLKVCICGAGTMGRGITMAVASRGIPVVLYDLNPDILSGAARWIEMELAQEVQKKRITVIEKENISHCISFTRQPEDCQAPIIIEAIIEKVEAKTALFLQVAGYNTEKTIFITNTSSLSVTGIAEGTHFPERIIGLHFFNPVSRMKLVEIIKTKYNSEELVNQVKKFAKQLEKIPILCQDAPGFIVNHVARPFYLEALRLAELPMADMATIDKLMLSAGFKMGPFHLMDLIGNDINYSVSSSLYDALGKPVRLKPSALQETYVNKGLLGRKTGSGFFQYVKPVAE
jgi:3-hydroxybutyryl-CoA dehydrogenase